MKKMILWTNNSNDGYDRISFLINPDNIVEKVALGDETVFMFPGLADTPENQEKVKSLIESTFDEDGDWDYSAITDALDESGLEWRIAEESEPVADTICYWMYSKETGLLSDCDTYKAYEYWDGSNWRERYFDDAIMYEYEIEVDEENSESLDRWDGSNLSYGGRFSHGKIYPVISVDGEKVENTYLLKTWSQYQGDIPAGEIISAEKAEELRTA